MKQKLIAGVLIFCMLFSLIPVSAFASIDVQMASIEETEVTTSSMMVLSPYMSDNMYGARNGSYCLEGGPFCDNLLWNLDNHGVLMISGSGPMELDVLPPWYHHLYEIYNIVIENGVTSIGFCAFTSCENLTSITLPDSITTIDDSAFSYCGNLTSIKIPKNVTKIGEDAFYGCERLTIYGYADSCAEIYANENDIPFAARSGSGTLGDNIVWTLDNDGTLTISGSGKMEIEELPPWYSMKDEIKQVVIKNGITSIGKCAFLMCGNLIEVSMPDSITEIGLGAFYDCDGLQEVELPKNVTTIDVEAFSCCDGLTDIECPDSLIAIGDDAFSYCSNLTSIKIPKNVTVIGETAFNECKALTISGVSGSYAETYAKNNRIPFTRTLRYTSPLKKDGEFKFASDLNQGDIWYKYSYDETLFFNDSGIYQHDLVKMSIRAALAAFGTGNSGKSKNIEAFMEDLEFHNIEANYPTPEVDSIGYAIGSKNVQSVNGEKCALLMVAVRGGGYGAEWGGNFELGREETHSGFNKAANKVLNGIETYIADYEDELNSNIKVWIMGYSRGAATANLVAKNLIDGKINSVEPENVFAFCFECPQNTKDGEKSNIKYNRIVNIVNPIDLVPKVAMSNWGYGRYGKTYYTPYKDGVIALKFREQNAAMKDVYTNILRPYRNDEINAENLIPDSTLLPALKGDILASTLAVCFISPGHFEQFHQLAIMYLAEKYLAEKDIDKFFEMVLEVIGTEPNALIIGLTYLLEYADDLAHIAKAHYGELCLAWIDSLSGEYEYANPKYRIVFVNCPVDVEVYDSTNNLVGSIVNDTIEDIEDGVVSFIDYNGQKMIALPCDEEYSIQLTATDNGTVTYTTTEFNLDTNSTEKVIGYHEVDIIAGDQLTGVIENLDTQPEAEYLLYKNDSDEPLQVSVSQTGSSVEEYQVNVTSSGYGMAYGGGNYITGEFAKVSAEANEGNAFLGWYANGELITDEPEYRFLVNGDVLLTAVFTENDTPLFDKGDVNLDNEVNMDDVVALLNHVVKADIITDSASLAAGEVTNDTELNMDDVVKLLNYVVKAIDSLD